MTRHPSDEDLREMAEICYQSSPLEIDRNGVVDRYGDGAWVQAWVWVDFKECIDDPDLGEESSTGL